MCLCSMQILSFYVSKTFGIFVFLKHLNTPPSIDLCVDFEFFHVVGWVLQELHGFVNSQLMVICHGSFL